MRGIMADITHEQLTRWAERCLQISHLNTLVQREITDGARTRAMLFSDRARRRASDLFNEMIAAGASKPEGYCREPEEI
jgi:hypothetical protein